jgi:hypothetical protein
MSVKGTNGMNKVLTVLSVIALLLISCGERKEKIVEVPVETSCPPAAPTGVFATNLEGYVEICWLPNHESDIAGYDVYRSSSLYGDYTFIGTVDRATPNPALYCFDDTETSNGVQHFYAVLAYDTGNLESDLSYEDVSGTPRPEGEITLDDYHTTPLRSGIDLSSLSNSPQSYTLPTTDVYYGTSGTTYLLISNRTDVDIQDYGYVGFFDGINYAPIDGWSPTRTAEAIEGHMYILRLHELDGFHYAKMYVKEAQIGFVTADWAYQTAAGNRDLAPPAPPGRGGLRTSSASDEMPGLNMAVRSTDVSAIPPIVERVTRTRDSRFEQQTTH